MRRTPLLTLVVLLACSAPAAAAPRLSEVGTFASPVYVVAPPGDPDRLFVVERRGTIAVMVDGGAPATFLDISDEVFSGGELGLLSMAFAPDYATSGRFYVFFTAPRPGDPDGSILRIDELHRSDTNPEAADESRRRTVLTVDHPTNDNHNGGQLQTGPDGMLWIGTGDGGGVIDPPNNAQNTRSLLGKLLRIDPDPSTTAEYTIPPDNPYADGAVAAPEIWAYGLRNPWRFSFDRATGDLTLGDVGQGAREEVDFAPRGTDAGVNYGWRCFEGSQRTPGVPPDCTPSGTYVPPVFEYLHDGGRCSLTGGYVVRHAGLPTLEGRYIYGDFCTGEVHSLALDKPSASDDRAEPLTVSTLSSFGEDACGHVYATSLAGTVYRIDDEPFAPCPGPPPPVAGGTGGSPPAGSPPAGSDPGGSPPGGSPPAGDDQPPKLNVTRARRQRLLANRWVYVGVECDELCGITSGGGVVAGSAKRYPLAAASRTLAARTRVRLRLKLSKAVRAALARRMAAGHRPLARVEITARDSAGNESRKAVHVRVVG